MTALPTFSLTPERPLSTNATWLRWIASHEARAILLDTRAEAETDPDDAAALRHEAAEERWMAAHKRYHVELETNPGAVWPAFVPADDRGAK